MGTDKDATPSCINEPKSNENNGKNNFTSIFKYKEKREKFIKNIST